MTRVHRDRVDQLISRHRPAPAADIDSLLPAAFYDQHLSAIAGLAATGHDDYEQRVQDLADTAHRWGFAALKNLTGAPPSSATAVYYGGIQLAAYLATHAAAVYCREHPTTSGDDALREIIAEFTTVLSRSGTSREDLLKLGMRLHRHTTTCGYSSDPDLKILSDLCHVGTAGGTAERNAARGAFARNVFDLLSTGSHDQVKTALQTAPTPAVSPASDGPV